MRKRKLLLGLLPPSAVLLFFVFLGVRQRIDPVVLLSVRFDLPWDGRNLGFLNENEWLFLRHSTLERGYVVSVRGETGTNERRRMAFEYQWVGRTSSLRPSRVEGDVRRYLSVFKARLEDASLESIEKRRTNEILRAYSNYLSNVTVLSNVEDPLNGVIQLGSRLVAIRREIYLEEQRSRMGRLAEIERSIGDAYSGELNLGVPRVSVVSSGSEFRLYLVGLVAFLISLVLFLRLSGSFRSRTSGEGR